MAEEHAAPHGSSSSPSGSSPRSSSRRTSHILAQLPTKEHAAKGTCRAWRRGWKEMLKKRERLRLVVIGGLGYGEVLNSLERYDPSTNEWEGEAETMPPMPTTRFNVGKAVLDGKFYAVGGWEPNDGALSSVERYDLATKAWEALAPISVAWGNFVPLASYGKLFF